MKLAVICQDELVLNMMATAASRRGHQCVTMGGADRLARSLPFLPNFVMVCVKDFVELEHPEVALVRHHCPAADVVIAAENIAAAARSAALRAGAIEVVQVPYNPFDLFTLLEHWESNRMGDGATSNSHRVSDLFVDLESYIATKNQAYLHLTRLELRLLYCLCEHFPNVAPTERLLAFAWGHDNDADASILRTHISHIRARLREAGGDRMEIVSRHSIGYTLTSVNPSQRPVDGDHSIER